MPNLTVSTAYYLRIMPLSQIIRFAVVDAVARISYMPQAISAEAVPGSIAIATSEEGGIITKSISYKRSGVSPHVSAELERLRNVHLVALYFDERGNERVAGSPDFPLAFSFVTEDGVYSCKLSGKAIENDPFIL